MCVCVCVCVHMHTQQDIILSLKKGSQAVVVPAFNSSIQETEAGSSVFELEASLVYKAKYKNCYTEKSCYTEQTNKQLNKEMKGTQWLHGLCHQFISELT